MNIKNILKRLTPIKVAILISLLGAYGGQGHKSYRRIGVPVILTLLALLYLKNWRVLTILSMIGVLSMGYGIPCPDDDDPSAIGKFWYEFFSLSHWKLRPILANMFTRGTIGSLVGLSLLSIPIIKSNWIIYIIGLFFIEMGYSFFSWRDLGVIQFDNDNYLLKSDLITYGIIGLATAIIIYI